jgi:zinc D-Ala-D-Ala dipeptidase
MNRRFWTSGCSWLALAFGLMANPSDKGADLVDVAKVIPAIRLDIRYATTNNFMHQAVYSSPKCYLRNSTAKKLAAVQKELESMGLGLKIYDGYRPLAVTKKMWDMIHDERYVADPAKGSKHNRGAALDLTLVTKEGKDLEMPTDHDNFTEKAHWQYKDLPVQVIKNRALLRYTMEKHGFEGISTEWWHFNDTEWKKFEILDVPLEKLE